MQKENSAGRTDIVGHDEIAELAKSFNFMADKLEQKIHENKELTANISHELRSPLARIKISRQLICDMFEENEISNTAIALKHLSSLKRYLEAIEDDSNALDNLIDKILTLSKMEQGLQSFQSTCFSLNEVLLELKEQYMPLFSNKKFSISFKSDTHETITSDRDALISIFTNLLDNALKYSEPNGSTQLIVESNKEVFTICTTNTFRHLTQNELDKIFNPFQRLEPHKAEGSGLGLALVKKQVEYLGGTITAANSTNGLQFTIHLPKTYQPSS